MSTIHFPYRYVEHSVKWTKCEFNVYPNVATAGNVSPPTADIFIEIDHRRRSGDLYWNFSK